MAGGGCIDALKQENLKKATVGVCFWRAYRSAHVRVVWECQLLSGGFRTAPSITVLPICIIKGAGGLCFLWDATVPKGGLRSGRADLDRHRPPRLIYTFRFSRSGRWVARAGISTSKRRASQERTFLSVHCARALVSLRSASRINGDKKAWPERTCRLPCLFVQCHQRASRRLT